MTVETLKDCNKKVLARMAKDQGIVGWHAMRKDQLIRALTPAPSSRKDSKSSKESVTSPAPAAAPRRPVVPVPARTLAPITPSHRPLDHAAIKDRIIVMVRDPYWLHAHWE